MLVCFVTGGCWLVPGWWQSFFVIAWCWLVPGGGGFCFQVEQVPRVVFARVGGSVKQRLLAVLWLVGHEGFAGQILFVFWF